MIDVERGGLAPRRGGLTSTNAPSNRGRGPRGAAFNRSRRSAYEPYTTHPHAPEPQKRGVAPSRFGPASRSDGEGATVHTDSKAITMARSLGASMARGLGILLIMMTLSEIAATRARPASTQRAAPSPIHRAPRAPPPLQNARRSSSAGRGDPGNERGQRRRGDSRDAPPHLIQKRRLRI